MKFNMIVARTVSGCAALIVNQAVVLEATSPAEVDKLVDAASKLGGVLGAGVTDYTVTSADTCWCKGWSDSAPTWSKLALQLDAAPEQPDTIPVRIWDAYESETEASNTHSFEISDQRQSNGQARLIVTEQGSRPEPDLLDVLLEVQASPFNEATHVPVAHVHVDLDDPVVSILKLGDKLLVRPNTGVRLEHEVVVIDGKPEDVVVIS